MTAFLFKNVYQQRMVPLSWKHQIPSFSRCFTGPSSVSASASNLMPIRRFTSTTAAAAPHDSTCNCPIHRTNNGLVSNSSSSGMTRLSPSFTVAASAYPSLRSTNTSRSFSTIEAMPPSVAANAAAQPAVEEDPKSRFIIIYTCKVCETRAAKSISKQAYTEGVVLIRCDGCKKLHLFADHLGWFDDARTNIEDIMKEKGMAVSRSSLDLTQEQLSKVIEAHTAAAAKAKQQQQHAATAEATSAATAAETTESKHHAKRHSHHTHHSDHSHHSHKK